MDPNTKKAIVLLHSIGGEKKRRSEIRNERRENLKTALLKKKQKIPKQGEGKEFRLKEKTLRTNRKGRRL